MLNLPVVLFDPTEQQMKKPQWRSGDYHIDQKETKQENTRQGYLFHARHLAARVLAHWYPETHNIIIRRDMIAMASAIPGSSCTSPRIRAAIWIVTRLISGPVNVQAVAYAPKEWANNKRNPPISDGARIGKAIRLQYCRFDAPRVEGSLFPIALQPKYRRLDKQNH